MSHLQSQHLGGEAETGASLECEASLIYIVVPGQPGICRETLTLFHQAHEPFPRSQQERDLKSTLRPCSLLLTPLASSQTHSSERWQRAFPQIQKVAETFQNQTQRLAQAFFLQYDLCPHTSRACHSLPITFISNQTHGSRDPRRQRTGINSLPRGCIV